MFEEEPTLLACAIVMCTLQYIDGCMFRDAFCAGIEI